MLSKESLGTLAEVALIIFVLGPLVGHLMGQPMILSYVETGSMSPTMEPGDGFVAIPKPLAGEINEGDIVVFQAEDLHDGGLVTHRVVGQNGDDTYVTKGDANPMTDQQGKEPPVKESQIVATALQVGGHAVVVPDIGGFASEGRDAGRLAKIWLATYLGVNATFGPGTILFLVSLGLGLVYVYDSMDERSGKKRSKSRQQKRHSGMDTRFALAVIALLLVTSATISMVLPSGTTNLPADQDETQTGNYTVENSGLAPIVVFFESDDQNLTISPSRLHVDSTGANRSRIAIAPDPEGRDRNLIEHHYLAILPTDTIYTLYTVHPWLPIFVIDALIGVPTYVIGIWLVGTGRMRERSRNRELSILATLRRAFRFQ